MYSLKGGFPGGSVLKNPPANAGDVGSIPELERYPGEGNCNPLKYSCLGNPTDRSAWQLESLGLQRAGNDLATKQQNSQKSLLKDTYTQDCHLQVHKVTP